jgi:hypothetical protein
MRSPLFLENEVRAGFNIFRYRWVPSLNHLLCSADLISERFSWTEMKWPWEDADGPFGISFWRESLIIVVCK